MIKHICYQLLMYFKLNLSNKLKLKKINSFLIYKLK